MTPGLTSQCRRAAHRHLRSQTDSVWVLEALVATEFERYCVTSRTVARYGSSVPGPMESRRRTGKRRMGELSLGQSHSASPLWGLENLADLTQWQWKPPSSPDALLQQHQVENTQRWSLARALRSLFHEPSTELSDTAHIGLGPGVVLNGVGEDNIVHTPEVTEQSIPNTIWNAQSIPSEVVDAGLNLLYQDLSTDNATRTRPNFANFCNSWKDSLATGLFFGEAICSVLDGIYCGLDTPQPGAAVPLERTISDKFKLDLLQATISGLSSHVDHEHVHFDRTAWNRVLQRISELRINTIRVFTEAMDHIPESHLDDISAGVHANLSAFLIASGCASKRSSLIRQVSKMAKPLRRFNLADHQHVLEDGTQYVLMHKESKDLNYSRMRLGWVQLLARLPSIDESYLARVCSILEAGKELRPLSNRSICEMYLARHSSSIKDMEKLQNPFLMGRADSKWFGFFTLALWRTGQFDHVKGLCKFLDKLGRAQDIMRLARGVRNVVKNEVVPLASLAIAGGQPVVAIDILSLYEKSKASRSGFWETKFSTEVLKILAACQSVRPNKVLGALRLKRLPRGIPRRREVRLSRHLLSEILRTTKAAMAFAISPSISSRTSLKLIWQCINYLRKHPNSVVPTAALRALLHNVTRDLARGGQGNTAQLRSFLYLLHQQAGRDKMVQIGMAIKRWREINKQRRHWGRMRP
ncbi:hypothetical protein F5Y06DRAFT_164936 [Hypoxylon sp. FL0890]|nr:hypothetical protein F5Y06DRAFT_164936 [Hypoxylon sp. FL0890]